MTTKRTTKTPMRAGYQSLTVKARQAIRMFVSLQMEAGKMDFISLTLRADRMQRDRLYEWLESRGYTWRSKRREWARSLRIRK